MKDRPQVAGAAGGVSAFLRVVTTSRIALPSLKIAIVVGLFLNLINQGIRLIDGDSVNWGQFVLNFCVPYCVASYSAAKNELRQRR